MVSRDHITLLTLYSCSFPAHTLPIVQLSRAAMAAVLRLAGGGAVAAHVSHAHVNEAGLEDHRRRSTTTVALEGNWLDYCRPHVAWLEN